VVDCASGAQQLYRCRFILDAPVKEIGSLNGVTINTVARRVILNSDETVLDTLRRIQFDQTEIRKHENITLADLLSDGIYCR
jgi:hypothetical protein